MSEELGLLAPLLVCAAVAAQNRLKPQEEQHCNTQTGIGSYKCAAMPAPAFALSCPSKARHNKHPLSRLPLVPAQAWLAPHTELYMCTHMNVCGSWLQRQKLGDGASMRTRGDCCVRPRCHMPQHQRDDHSSSGASVFCSAPPTWPRSSTLTKCKYPVGKSCSRRNAMKPCSSAHRANVVPGCAAVAGQRPRVTTIERNTLISKTPSMCSAVDVALLSACHVGTFRGGQSNHFSAPLRERLLTVALPVLGIGAADVIYRTWRPLLSLLNAPALRVRHRVKPGNLR